MLAEEAIRSVIKSVDLVLEPVLEVRDLEEHRLNVCVSAGASHENLNDIFLLYQDICIWRIVVRWSS